MPRPVDLRVVTASKRDLARRSRRQLREDLFYRLNVVRLRIPPLRERRSDIPQLFAHFVEQGGEQIGEGRFQMSDTVRRHLVDHDWPGNVRELRNFAFGAVLDLPHQGVRRLYSADVLPRASAGFEAAIIRESLAATAARSSRPRSCSDPAKTLYDKMGRRGIDPKGFRSASWQQLKSKQKQKH